MSGVAVVGLGLIGGSAAMAFSARGWDRDATARRAARERGIDVAETLEDAVRGAELVLLAVPTAETPAALEQAARLAGDALLTDAASWKGPVLAAARSLPPGTRFVAGHPMAGAAASGIAHATADLFRGRPWLVIATERSDARSIEMLSERVRGIGAVPTPITGDRHDEAMTWVSHLPLGVAAALARSVRRRLGEDASRLSGPGLADSTRLAATPLPLALELALASPADLASALDAVAADLTALAGILRRRDASLLEAFLLGGSGL